MYLLDSNILLELMLDQDKADEVACFLDRCPPSSIHLSDLSLYSIGIILLHRKLFDVLIQFPDDLLVTGGIHIARLELVEMQAVAEAAKRFSLDFDDAYQYVLASRRDYTLISFDSDFDRTDLKRDAPAQVLESLE